jgi:hypothetical protein
MAHGCLQEKKCHYSPISSVIPTISSAGYHQHILLARENRCRENGTVQYIQKLFGGGDMPTSLVWEPRGVHYRHFGRITATDLSEGSKQITESPKFGEIAYVISDFLEVEELVVTRYETLLRAAEDHWAAESNRTFKFAVVGDKPEIVDAFALYGNSPLIKDTVQLKLFSTLKDARDWVDG